jgi:hypothetical protein
VAPASARGTTALAQPGNGGLEHSWGKELVICSAAWSNERWPFFGVEEFPDVEAVQRHEQILTDLNWARYIESRTTLGTVSVAMKKSPVVARSRSPVLAS